MIYRFNMLRATSITQLFPKTQPGGSVVHVVEHYQVGNECRIPNYGFEKVLEIVIILEPQLIAAILFEDYGTIWITSHIIEIRYEREDYREVRRKKLDAKRTKDSTGK
jgi:hypothetical protein